MAALFLKCKIFLNCWCSVNFIIILLFLHISKISLIVWLCFHYWV
jgi:hypothetical protein